MLSLTGDAEQREGEGQCTARQVTGVDSVVSGYTVAVWLLRSVGYGGHNRAGGVQKRAWMVDNYR